MKQSIKKIREAATELTLYIAEAEELAKKPVSSVINGIKLKYIPGDLFYHVRDIRSDNQTLEDIVCEDVVKFVAIGPKELIHDDYGYGFEEAQKKGMGVAYITSGLLDNKEHDVFTEDTMYDTEAEAKVVAKKRLAIASKEFRENKKYRNQNKINDLKDELERLESE